MLRLWSRLLSVTALSDRQERFVMVTPQVIWNGTQQEANELVDVLTRHCTCEFGVMGIRKSICPPHDAFCHNQRWLDGLLVERRRRQQLLDQEHQPESQA
jgi:hypothetical protein